MEDYYFDIPDRQPFTPPFGPPGQPPFVPGRPPGAPPTVPGRPPGVPPTIPGGPPTSPPPAFRPEFTPFRVDPGAIRQCLYRYTYVWLRNGREFWFYPTFVGPRSIAGYRWYRFFWVYYGTDLDNITSFFCY
jgi:hypothetical protein